MDKVKAAWGKAVDFAKHMSRKLKILLLAGLILIAALVVALIVYNNTRPYAVLFTELSSEDMASVVTYLEENGVRNYQIRDNDTILVPEAQESSLRARLLMSGSYPKSGFSYDTYLNNVGMLSSESDRDRLDLYETQDRLGATIALLDGVESAVVTITPQEDNRWILNTENLTQARAHVLVTMRDGYDMTGQMAETIRNLLLTGVKGLDIDNCVVGDQTGKSWSGGQNVDASDSAALMVSLQNQADERIHNNVLDVLGPMFGPENLAVSVTTTVDVSKTYEESITYHFPEETAWNSLGGHGLIGEYVWDNSLLRGDNETAGGVVGTTTNADLHEYVINQGIIDGDAQQIGASGSIQYDNDKTTVQKEGYGGVLTDVMVSVAINSAAIQDTTMNTVESMIPVVARAAGINAEVEGEKVAIVLRAFHTEDEPEPTPPGGILLQDWVIYALIAGFALFLLLLVVIILLRGRSKKRKAAKLAAEQAAAAAEAAALIPAMAGGPPEDQGAQIMDIEAERTMELRQNVRTFVEENPEIAAQMLKTWLRGGDENG